MKLIIPVILALSTCYVCKACVIDDPIQTSQGKLTYYQENSDFLTHCHLPGCPADQAAIHIAYLNLSLLHAVKDGNLENFWTFLKLGASFNATDQEGKSTFDYAQEGRTKEHLTIKTFLLSFRDHSYSATSCVQHKAS